jgi:hypothetical protein
MAVREGTNTCTAGIFDVEVEGGVARKGVVMVVVIQAIADDPCVATWAVNMAAEVNNVAGNMCDRAVQERDMGVEVATAKTAVRCVAELLVMTTGAEEVTADIRQADPAATGTGDVASAAADVATKEPIVKAETATVGVEATKAEVGEATKEAGVGTMGAECDIEDQDCMGSPGGVAAMCDVDVNVVVSGGDMAVKVYDVETTAGLLKVMAEVGAGRKGPAEVQVMSRCGGNVDETMSGVGKQGGLSQEVRTMGVEGPAMRREIAAADVVEVVRSWILWMIQEHGGPVLGFQMWECQHHGTMGMPASPGWVVGVKPSPHK